MWIRKIIEKRGKRVRGHGRGGGGRRYIKEDIYKKNIKRITLKKVQGHKKTMRKKQNIIKIINTKKYKKHKQMQTERVRP